MILAQAREEKHIARRIVAKHHALPPIEREQMRMPKPSGLVSSSGVNEMADSLAASFWEQWKIMRCYVRWFFGACDFCDVTMQDVTPRLM